MSLLFLSFLVSFSLAAVPKASTLPRAAQAPRITNMFIPHITHGNNWKTKFVVMNVSPRTTEYALAFINADGSDALLPLKQLGPVSYVYNTLPPGGSDFFETIDDASPNETWYTGALIDGHGDIQLFAIFSWSIPGFTPVEVTVPATDMGVNEGITTPIYFPVNNTEGFSTALAVANWNTDPQGVYHPTMYQLTVHDISGKTVFLGYISMPQPHRAFLLPQEFPQLQGIRGMGVLKPVPGFDFRCALLTLQFHPSGSVTSLPAFNQSLAPAPF